MSKSRLPRLKGRSVIELLASHDAGVISQAVRLVVINALAATLYRAENYRVIEGFDVLDLLNLERIRSITMVGAIPPFMERLKDMPNLDFKVVEKKSETLTGDMRRFCVPLEQTQQALSQCDVAVLTGAAVANGTIDSLLAWTPPRAFVIVVGPTASFVPDVLFSRGVAITSGVIVSDPDQAVDMVSEGGSCIPPFSRMCQKGQYRQPRNGRQRDDKSCFRR